MRHRRRVPEIDYNPITSFRVRVADPVKSLEKIGYRRHEKPNHGWIKYVGHKGSRFHAYIKADGMIELHFDEVVNGFHQSDMPSFRQLDKELYRIRNAV